MNQRQRVASGLVVAVVTGSLVLGLAPAALADDTGSVAKQVASVVERATGTEDLAAGAAGSTVTSGEDGQTSVTIPDASTDKAAVTAADGSAVALSLPQTRNVSGVRAGAGTVVYPDAATGTDLAVQATTDGGARALVTLKNDKAPTTHDFRLDLPEGTDLVPNEQGGYDIAKHLPAGGTVVMGQVDAPWAKDATGKSLPTHYNLNGTTLTQTVDTANAAFPVVADPKVTWGYVTGTIYFNRGETRSIALGGGLGATAIAAIPGGITTVVGVTMAAITARAAAAYDRGRCLKIKLPHVYPDHYAGGYCQ
ncbi:hypothetical protein ABTY61_28005 [Kitasatospora sp. NPDC096128]|uniref:hypothetical protein n=1 Tax=Kitasatospora sp. NPDC096128 TaxID=3155547 RepID=UPI00331C5C9B